MTVIILGHLAGFLLLTWLITFLARRRFRSDRARGLTAILSAAVLCAAYLGGAAINAVTVRRTDYALTTRNDTGRDSLRVALISDAHLGSAIDADGLAEQLERIQACSPDLLAVTGDLVDDGTSREEMLAACEAFGSLELPLGIYFVPGNHEGRELDGFYAYELYDALRENGVTVLTDTIVRLDDSLFICGRRDAYYRDRLSILELLGPLDEDDYIIVLDHQPSDYAAEAQAGADLVLSGHTHGGQLLPLPLALRPMGFCDKVYGHEQRGNTHFIVTSGIGALKVPLRTGTPTEFVIIDITQE